MNRRLPALILLVAAVIAMLVVDRGDDDAAVGTSADPATEAGFGLPVASPAGSLSSTWFCAGGTASGTDDELAAHTVVIANPTESAIGGTVTAYAGAIAPSPSPDEELEAGTTTTSTAPVKPPKLPAPVTEAIEVPARSRLEVSLVKLIKAPLASAVVELPGGEFAVEHRVRSRHGSDSAPCATDAAPDWHFAWGATTRDAREVLVFFNPFPDDAVIDATFNTDKGPRETTRFDGFVVPGRSVVGVELGDDVTRRTQISASFRTRSGRVVIDRIQRFDGSNGTRGLTVRLGMPRPSETWLFPDGLVDEGINERFVLYNPTERSAEIEIEVVLDDPSKNGVPEPFAASLLPGAFEIVDIAKDGRIKAGIGHSGIVRSLNGVPIVAERVITATEPATRRGVSVTSGSPVAAPVWLFADGVTSKSRDQFLYLLNPSNEFLTTVSVTALAKGQPLAIEGLQDLELGPAARLAIRLGSRVLRDDLALVVTSTEPIVVERGLYAAEGPGVSNSIGIPIAEGIIFPPPFLVDVETDDGG